MRVEDHDAHRRGVDQRFQICLGSPLRAVTAGVGDDKGRLGGEHHEGRLILLAEFPPLGLVSKIDGADADSLVTHWCHQQRGRRHRGRELGQPQRAQVAGDVRDSEGSLHRAEVLEESQSLGHVP